MDKFALLALLNAKPGKEKEVEEFLKSAQPMAVRETGTSTWYAVKLGPKKFGIFDTFKDEDGQRCASERRDCQGACSRRRRAVF